MWGARGAANICNYDNLRAAHVNVTADASGHAFCEDLGSNGRRVQGASLQ